MKVLILAQKFDNYSINSLTKILKARKHTIIYTTPFDITIRISKKPTLIYKNTELSKINVALLRCSGFSPFTKNVARVLEFHIGTQLSYSGTICINAPDAKQKAQNKFQTLQMLNNARIPVPDSFLVWDTKQFERIITNHLGTPVINKLEEGTWGVGVMKTDSLASARSVFESIRGMGHITTTQKYIDFRTGNDIRAFVVNNNVVAAMRRIATKGEFRSNVHQGGKAIKIDLQNSYKDIAIAATKTLGLKIAGVDIIETATGPQILEINPTPGLEGIEKTTGVNVAEHIVKYLENISS